MTWLVQAMGIDIRNGNKIMEALLAKGIPFIPVGVRPFSTEISGLDGVELEQGKVMTYGSTKLVRLAKEMGLTPGAFFDLSTFNMMVWKAKFCHSNTIRKHNNIGFFNDECEFVQIRDLSGELQHDRFVRPVLDLKAFDGQVVQAGDTWEGFFARTFKTETFDTNLMVAVGRIWPIRSEYRIFIVNRKVVTATRYRLNNKIDMSAEVEPDVIQKANEVIDVWLPHDHCVLDLARGDGGLEILEFNCINASGLYFADAGKLVDALNSLMV